MKTILKDTMKHCTIKRVSSIYFQKETLSSEKELEWHLSLIKAIKYELIHTTNFLIGLICCALWFMNYALPKETLIQEIICYFWILWCISFFSHFWLFVLCIFRYCFLKYALQKKNCFPILTIYNIEYWIDKISFILVPQLVALLIYMYLN